jgi:TRAP-type uncharacterized transport system fused permease subunit
MFVYEPSLLSIGDPLSSVTAAVSAVIGVVCLAAGLHGFLVRECGTISRIVLLAASILLIKPGFVTDAIGLALLAGVLVAQRFIVPRKGT